MNENEQLVKELEHELRTLQDELAILNKFFNQKGIDGNKYRDAMAQKNEVEKMIKEVELDIEITKKEIENEKNEPNE